MIKKIKSSTSILKRLCELENQNFGGEAWNSATLQDIFDAEYLTVFGCYVGGNLIGYCALSVAGEQGDIANIVVDNEHKGKGYGRQMLRFMIKQAQKQNVEKLFLEVNTRNVTAINLYQSEGFETIRIRKNYYENSKFNSNDAYCMMKIL